MSTEKKIVKSRELLTENTYDAIKNAIVTKRFSTGQKLTYGDLENNYHAYCTSIVRLAALEGRMVLPGHRQTIDSVKAIIQFYISKLLNRVEQLLPVKDEPNVARLISRLFNNSMTDVFHIYLKASEIIFMQDFLAEPELLENALAEIGLMDNVAALYKRATGR
jgi:hypothetical protein